MNEKIRISFNSSQHGNNFTKSFLKLRNLLWHPKKTIEKKVRPTRFHECLYPNKNPFKNSKQLRKENIKRLKFLLNDKDALIHLNDRDHNDETPLQLAIRLGLDGCVKLLLKAQADPFMLYKTAESSLEFAARLGKAEIYKLLLDHHIKCNKKAGETKKNGIGYELNQITSASNTYTKKLQRRKKHLGFIGALLAVACPIGSLIAFNELPFLGILLTALLPTVGPFIALGGAIVLGGLLFWATYKKGTIKYGKLEQEKVQLRATNAKMERLKSEFLFLTERLNRNPNSKELQVEVSAKKSQLNQMIQKIPRVEERDEMAAMDWADHSDVVKGRIVTVGTFMCAFSGVLAILGGGASFFPAVLVLGGLALGVPVAGWIALGAALVLGGVIGFLIYKTKYDTTLEAFGKARKDLHNTQYELSQNAQKCSEVIAAAPANEANPSPQKNRSSLDEPKKIVETHTLEVEAMTQNSNGFRNGN